MVNLVGSWPVTCRVLSIPGQSGCQVELVFSWRICNHQSTEMSCLRCSFPSLLYPSFGQPRALIPLNAWILASPHLLQSHRSHPLRSRLHCLSSTTNPGSTRHTAILGIEDSIETIAVDRCLPLPSRTFFLSPFSPVPRGLECGEKGTSIMLRASNIPIEVGRCLLP